MKILDLSIEKISEGSIARCYRFEKFQITTLRPLTKEQVSALFNFGFLGGGQQFFPGVISKEPAGCYEYGERLIPYYQHTVETRTDSSG